MGTTWKVCDGSFDPDKYLLERAHEVINSVAAFAQGCTIAPKNELVDPATMRYAAVCSSEDADYEVELEFLLKLARDGIYLVLVTLRFRRFRPTPVGVEE